MRKISQGSPNVALLILAFEKIMECGKVESTLLVAQYDFVLYYACHILHNEISLETEPLQLFILVCKIDQEDIKPNHYNQLWKQEQ